MSSEVLLCPGYSTGVSAFLIVLMEDTGEECVRACGLEEGRVGLCAVNTCSNGDGPDNSEEQQGNWKWEGAVRGSATPEITVAELNRSV